MIRQVRSLTITFLFLSVPIWAQTNSKQKALTSDAVVRMVRSGQSTASIIEQIQNSERAFDVWSPNFTTDMKQKGVPQVVINEMVENQIMYRRDPALPAAMLGNLDVRNMLAAGTPASVIVEKIEDSLCDFDTSPAALTRLKRNGVPPSVIVAMIRASGAAPSELTDARYLAYFPACSDFLSAAKAATSVDWLVANIQSVKDGVNRCGGDPDVKRSPRGTDALVAEVATLALPLLAQRSDAYEQLLSQYNQLADRYNALRGAILVQHLQPTIPPFACTAVGETTVCYPF